MTKYHIKNNDTNEEYTVTEHDDPNLIPKQEEPKQTNKQFQQDVKRLYAKYEKEEQAKTKSK